jgi:hypothetical protein
LFGDLARAVMLSPTPAPHLFIAVTFKPAKVPTNFQIKLRLALPANDKFVKIFSDKEVEQVAAP